MEIVNEKDFDEKVKKSNKIVLVDFFANWCGPCKMLSPILQDAYSELDQNKFDFFKVDIDQSEDLAREFGVMSIPTMIIFKDGKEVDKMIGLRQKSQIINVLNSLV